MYVRVLFGLLWIMCYMPDGVLLQNVLPILDVDFESSSLGGFSQNRVDAYDWNWRTGRSQMYVNGPLVDHSTATSRGHFMFVNTVSWRRGSSAEILSPELPVTESPRCVRYFYYMTGITPGSLTVRVRGQGLEVNVTSQVIDMQTGDRGPGWNRGMADIPPQSNLYKITFEATSGSAIGGEIAIDDVQLLDAACPEEALRCPFEKPDLCGFVQDTTDDGNLVHQNGKTDSFYTGPSTDHTFGNSSGYYVYMEATPLGRNQNVRLISPTLRGVPTDQDAHCLVFWYHMYGMAVDSLAVYLMEASTKTATLGTAEPDWILRGNRGNLWRATEVPITKRKDYKIVFEFRRGVRYDGDIAIDDVIVTDYACPGTHVFPNTSSVSCDFEEADICQYTQDKSRDTEDWQWGNGNTYIDFTGPSADHTRGDELGFYLFFERSVNGGNDARIISPPIQPQKAASCVEFWFHMYGTDVNALIVYINRVDGSLPDRPVWNMTGNRGDRWHRAELMVPASLYPLHLVFHALGGDEFRDNIAIDDVRLYESGSCPDGSRTFEPSEPMPPLISSIKCPFEAGWCNFTQMTDDVFDWKLGKGPSSDQNVPDMIDHTFGNKTGTYAYIDTSQRFLRTNDKARIKSSLLHPSPNPRCFTFYYHMSSTNADFLNVYVVPYGGTQSFDPQFVVFGRQQKKWVKAAVQIEPSTNPVSIIIEGVIGPIRSNGDIAIDDIRLKEMACSYVIEVTTPAPAPLTADCDFEDDRGCGYVQAADDDFDWKRHRGRTHTAETGPVVDHTKGTAEGFYIYAEASQPQRPGDRASFSIRPIPGNNQPMCLRFFYFMNGVDTGSLRVSIVLPGHQTRSDGIEVFRLDGMKMATWLPAHVDIMETDGPFQLKFDAYIGDSYRSDIALDDITFLRRPCDGLPSESLCDFEKGLLDCQYQVAGGPSQFFQWSWFDSSTPSMPVQDTLKALTQEGTRNSFVFLMVENKPIKADSTANISSPYLSTILRFDHCININYALSSGGELDVKVYIECENGSSIFLQQLDASTQWKKASIPVDVDNSYNPFRVTFVARLGDKTDSDVEIIAIDDIAITVGACQTSKFLIIDGEHIPLIALALVLSIALLALFVVCVVWTRRRSRGPFPVMFLQRRRSDESPITMPLSNNSEQLISNGINNDGYRA